MRTLALIFFLPSFVCANCECDDVYKEIAWERQEDSKYHGCRNCKAVQSSDMDVSACPAYGYECNVDWKITSNSKFFSDISRSKNSRLLPKKMLVAVFFADRYQCAEARCAGTARLAFEKTIVNKMRCNNSQWIVGEKPAKPVVCAKSCDLGVCKASHPRASSDFKPLTVKPSDAETRCARGVCEPDYGMSALNADGSLKMRLPGVTEVTCTGEGIWRDVGPYVMCNALPYCGVGRCAAFVEGPAMSSGLVIPLTVKDNGEQCATATCQYGFVTMTSEGNIFAPVPDGSFPQLTCVADSGSWTSDSGATFAFVMCKPKPNCGPGRCAAFIDGPAMASGRAIPLTVKDNGEQCATATCQYGYVTMTRDGDVSAPLPDGSISQLTCQSDTGYWVSDTQTTFTFIMCKPKPPPLECPVYTKATAADCAMASAMCSSDAPDITTTKISCPKNKPVVVLTTVPVTSTTVLHQNTPLNSPAIVCEDGVWYTGDPKRPLDNKPTLPLLQPVRLGCFGTAGG